MPTSRSLLTTLLAALLVFGAAGPSSAQPASGARITPNFKDADITQVIEAVAAATGRNIIVDPRVRAQVTMLSSTPMTPDAFYEAFLALLQVHGFVAAPSGDVLKIIPDANSRTMPGNDLPDRLSATSDEIVTQVVSVTNVSAAQLVAILRPLMPQNAHLAAYPSSNMLILADRANNVNRMLRIIRRIDQASDADIEVVAMQNASAAEVVRTMTALNPAQASAEGGMSFRCASSPMIARTAFCSPAIKRSVYAHAPSLLISTRRSRAVAIPACAICATPMPKKSPQNSKNKFKV